MTHETLTRITCTVPAASLLTVVRVLDFGDTKSRDAFASAFDDLRASFTPNEIATGIISEPVADALEAPTGFEGMIAHLERQRAWSAKTFGPGARLAGVVDHIRKELREIEADPTDLKEWVDVLLLAFDGAWRAGWQPTEIVEAILAKQEKNESRVWPDWRAVPQNKAIEHDRSLEQRSSE